MPATTPITDEFIGEPIQPDANTFDPARMAVGEPGLPRKFQWRKETVEVHSVVRSWRETGPCTHGSDEQYVRKHWYELETNRGQMRVYFERQARGRSAAPHWWLFSMRAANAAATPNE